MEQNFRKSLYQFPCGLQLNPSSMLDEEGNNAMCRGEGIQRGFPVQNFLLVSISWPDIVFGKPKCSLKWALYYAHSKLMLQSFSEWLLSWEYIHIFAFIPKTLAIALVVGPRTYNTMVLAYLLPVLTRVTQPWYLLISTHCTTCRRRAERGPAGECR